MNTFDILISIILALLLIAIPLTYYLFVGKPKWLFSKKDKDALSDANWKEKK